MADSSLNFIRKLRRILPPREFNVFTVASRTQRLSKNVEEFRDVNADPQIQTGSEDI